MPEPESILMEVRNYLRTADQYLKSGEFDSARTNAEQAIETAHNQDHTPSLAAAYYGLASVIWNSGGTSEEAHHYASLAAQHTKANTTTDLLVRTLIARIKAARGNFDAAIFLNQDLLNYYEHDEDIQGRADVLRSMGDIYFAQGDYDLAREHYFRSLDLYKQLDEPLNHAGLLLSMGALMFQIDYRDEARRYWQETRSIAEANGFRYILDRVDEAMELLDS